jgi:2-keto-3-deoxy-L-rhamnonate aldolase RhmA
MRTRLLVASVAMLGSIAALIGAQPSAHRHLNPVIDLLEHRQAVFGLYAPSNRRFGRGGAAPADAPPPKSQDALAGEALAYPNSDFVFDGTMEGGVDKGLPPFIEFVTALKGTAARTHASLASHPLIVKTEKIAPNFDKAVDNIGRELNVGTSGIMFVETESADEVRRGLSAMRFKANGGTRSDDVGAAPAYWGLSEAEYRKKADLWPLNPDGELVNWTIVESREGLAHVREIAAVKGIGVLWPGAGTLRGVFTTTGPDGQRAFDEKAWEGAIQQVLAACKEFHVPCGYPANANDIEMRMKQGFSVFVMNWGDPGFKAIDIGRKTAGR